MKAIGYLMGGFPALTQTFIVGEILELRRRGIPIILYALAATRTTRVQPDAAALSGEVRYAAPLWSRRLLSANARWLVRAPRRYVATLGLLVRRAWRNPVHLLKALYIFPKAIELGDDMQRRAVGHVHAHWATYPTTAALVVSEVSGLSYSFAAHAGDITLFRTLLAEKIRRARFVVTCTADLRADLLGFTPWATRDKIHLNYHGVALERFPLADRHGVRSGPLTIFACGALEERKGFADVVDACRILKERGYDFRCVIVGEGPQRAALAARIADARLDDCIMLAGAASHAEVGRHYRESDVFVLPCQERRPKGWDPEIGFIKTLEAWFEPAGGAIRDGIPNVLAEAMATGLPVVTTPVYGIPELVRDGSNGLFVRPGDPVQLAGALERLVTDGALRLRLGTDAAQSIRADFDRRQQVTELVAIFQHHLGVGVDRSARQFAMSGGGAPAVAAGHAPAGVIENSGGHTGMSDKAVLRRRPW